MLRWTLEAFDACPDVDAILVVVGDATRDLVAGVEWRMAPLPSPSPPQRRAGPSVT